MLQIVVQQVLASRESLAESLEESESDDINLMSQVQSSTQHTCGGGGLIRIKINSVQVFSLSAYLKILISKEEMDFTNS